MRICAHPGCNELTNVSRCPAHTKAKEAERGKTSERGYGWRWQKVSTLYRKQNPLCVQCLKDGRTEATAVVDHIIPHRGNEHLFWDKRNWQPLCKRCHDIKTARGM